MKMKKRNFTKLFVIAVALAALLTLFTVAVSAAEPSDLDIYGKNLSFDNEVHIFYAVKSADPSIKLHVWTEGTLGGEPTVLEPIFGQDVEGTVCTVFKFTGINAKQMTDNIYAQAVVTDGETETCGKMSKYSILQYAYNKLGKTGTASTDEKLKALLVGMLEYGALAQDKFGYKADRPANADWVQVKLTGGTLPDGFGYGLYLPGDVVSITAPETLDGAAFLHWQDESETVIATTPIHDLTVGNVNQTYAAKYETYSEGLEFTSNGNGTCYVSGIGTCTDTDIRIPTVSPEGDNVTSIGNDAFSNCGSLISITIPDSVTSIGNDAFSDCGSLISITIPDSVTSIGDGAFFRCRSLTSITIPDSVTSIGERAFYYCTRLTSITIPDSVTSIGGGAFSGCSNLVYNKKGGVEYLGNGTNPYIVAVDTYTNITSVSLPDTVKIILHEAFYNCSSLTSITIPDGVTSIGTSAFLYCSSLTSITIPASVTSIGGDAFSDCSSLETVTFAEGSQLMSIGSYAFYRCNSLTSITIPASVTSIGSYAFSGCSSLTNITIPASVTSIGSSAFEDCRSLTSITFEGTMEQWNAITKGGDWNYNTGAYVIHCTDGDIAKS